MRNYFIYNGRDSRDFGVYINGQGTFSAPQKAYQFYNIPGRNGALIGYDNRFENIEVSYDAFIYKDFSKNIAEFRSFLLSVPGYARLEDSYHPDEFRMAAYVGAFEPEVTPKNDSGQFTITFTCKPQRYLKSGETRYRLFGGVLTNYGNSIRLYAPNIDTSTLTVDLPLVQEGSGTPSPMNPRPIDLWDEVYILIDGADFYRRTFTDSQKCVAGTMNVITGELSKTWVIKRVTSRTWVEDLSPHRYRWDGFLSGVDGSTATSTHMSPYSGGDDNVWRDLEFEISGSALRIYSSRFLNANYLNEYLDENEVYVAAQLTTPTVYNLAAFTPNYPEGWHSFSSNGRMTITFIGATELINPTMFPSKPLIRVFGNGTFTMNDVTVTITGATSYTDIDCEMMDCYEGSTNRNQNVSFSTYDFPELKVGSNTVSGENITMVYIWPRWWRL